MFNFYEYYNKPCLDNHELYSHQLENITDCIWVNIQYTECDNILHIIKKHPTDAYHYSYWVDYSRWPDAEPYILKNIPIAILYAINVMLERWPELESIMEHDTIFWHRERYRDYCRVFSLL